ncbi:hypothetical protein [uncultured Dokdonia sp.]|uniref:hypothetical protein n=1 Tax=uncultured Dokdonia sp. TaxID=575653 RepID=UPI00260CA024|nr:hypothetical protein [uncultured Dokdonia sp.]
MLKNISSLGNVLNEKEQKSIQGGEQGHCPPNYCVNYSGGCTNVTTAFFDDCA